MTESRTRTGEPAPELGESEQRARPREGAERDQDPARAQQAQLPDEVGQAVVPLVRGRAVLWRRTAFARVDVGVPQAQTVVHAHRGRLVREPGSVKCGEQPVAGTVAREDPAGPI